MAFWKPKKKELTLAQKQKHAFRAALEPELLTQSPAIAREPTEDRQLTVLSQLSFIKTEEDIEFFVRVIGKLWSEKHTKDSDDFVTELPKGVLQLIWIIVAYMKENVRSSEQTVDSMLKLLTVCNPESKRHNESSFDILVGDCKQEIVKKRYEYFKYSVFGIHSNCYRETVQLCVDVLQDVDLEAVVEAFEKAKNKQQEDSEPESKERPIFGELTKRTGQDYQVEQYEKYLTALHESSHAVAAYLLGLNFSGISIIATDDAAGMIQPKEWKKEPAQKKAMCLYAGPAGEMAVLNPLFRRVWGDGSDVYNATRMIKNEIIQELSNPRDAMKYVFVDADALGLADKESPYIIYETIKRCVDVRQQAIDLITTNKDMVAALAQELLEKQYLPSEEVIKFLDVWQSQAAIKL